MVPGDSESERWEMVRDAESKEPRPEKLMERWNQLKGQTDIYAQELVSARKLGDSKRVTELHTLWKKYYTQTHKLYMLMKRLGIFR